MPSSGIQATRQSKVLKPFSHGQESEDGSHLQQHYVPKGRSHGRKDSPGPHQLKFIEQSGPQHAPSARVNGVGQSHWGETVPEVV